MQVMFNAKERTLREIVALALSAGWKVTKVTRAHGSLFGHILAVPVAIPVENDDDQTSNQPGRTGGFGESVSVPAATTVETDIDAVVADEDDATGVCEESRIDTPTFAFASNVDLRSVVADSISTSMSISTTTSVIDVAAAGRTTGQRASGWGIGRKASSPLLKPQPSNGVLKMGVESNSESSGSGSGDGYGRSTGSGRNDNANGKRVPVLKKKRSLGKTSLFIGLV
jgi:hypothetical protein